jgi:hypothetical protein
VNHGGDSVMVWAAILCSVGPSITLQGWITAREYLRWQVE